MCPLSGVFFNYCILIFNKIVILIVTPIVILCIEKILNCILVLP